MIRGKKRRRSNGLSNQYGPLLCEADASKVQYRCCSMLVSGWIVRKLRQSQWDAYSHIHHQSYQGHPRLCLLKTRKLDGVVQAKTEESLQVSARE